MRCDSIIRRQEKKNQVVTRVGAEREEQQSTEDFRGGETVLEATVVVAA